MKMSALQKLALTRIGSFFAVLLMLISLAVVSPTKVWAQAAAGANDGAINPVEVNDADFDALNPLVIAGSTQADNFKTPGGLLNQVLVFAFPMAGLILFSMLLWGGFSMLSGSASKNSIEAGKQRITAALLGFLMLFVAYWIVQLAGTILGIRILGA